MSTYLITQATGGQSQAVIKQLLATGAKVHAVVRDPSKTLPPILQDPAVTIFKGNSENQNEIYEAAKGCKGVFLNTFPIPGLETQQAQSVVNAAKAAGIESIVASTTFFASDPSVWDDDVTKSAGLHGYFASKAAVEKIVRAGNFASHTFVRPGFIHHDYLAGHTEGNWTTLTTRAELDHDYEEGTRIPHTMLGDLARFVVAALLDPAKFNGAGIELLAENLTVEEAAATLSKVAGREVKAKKRSDEEREALRGKLFVQGFHVWANEKDFSEKMRAAKDDADKYGIQFTTLEDALMEDRELLVAALPKA